MSKGSNNTTEHYNTTFKLPELFYMRKEPEIELQKFCGKGH